MAGTALHRALDERRASLNTRFYAAKRANPRLDGDAVLLFVDGLAPVADAVEAVSPEAVGAVIERLVDVALPLVARGLLGPAAASELLNQGWSRLLVVAPQLWIDAPERLARALSNALYKLDRHPTAKPGLWLERMVAAGEQAEDLSSWLDLGLMLGWRAGLAQHRAGALAVAERLSPALLGLGLGVQIHSETDRSATLASLVDPWFDPALPGTPTLRQVGQIGGFRGLGGPFLNPPRVGLVDGVLSASDAVATYTVHADRFGCAFTRAATVNYPAQSWPYVVGPLSLGTVGALRWGSDALVFPEIAGCSSAAFDGHTLAVTHPQTHHIALFARAAP